MSTTENSKKTIRLGLYGCGARTNSLVSVLWGDEPVAVAAGYDVVEEAARKTCDKFGGRVCKSSQELLACEDVDAFIISLAPQAHYEAFMETVEVGKPIYQEKPIAMSAKEALQMVKAAEEKQVSVHVGFVYRYTAAIRSLRSYFRDNPIGTIYGCAFQWFGAVETEIINLANLGKSDDFRAKLSQVEIHCCHQFDLMRLFCGEVKKVYAKSVKWTTWNYVTPDEVTVIFEFESGAIGTWQYSQHCSKGRTGGQIHGRNYSVDFGNFGPYEIAHRPPSKALRDPGPGEDCRDRWSGQVGPDRFDAPRGFNRSGCNEWDVYIMRDFLTMARGEQSSQTTLMDGYKVAEIAEAIDLSAKENREVELPLHT